MNFVAKILVADDHPLVRAGVTAALADKDFCRVVGEASDGRETLELVDRLRPDLLVLDLEMDGRPPEKLIGDCLEILSDLKILILSCHVQPKHLLPLRDLNIGGFMVKWEAADSLAQAIRVVLAGEKWFSHEVAGLMTGCLRGDGDVLDRLTPREFQVLQLMHEGRDNESIAQTLGLSKQTIRRYATIIYEKLSVKNRVEAILVLDGRSLTV